MGGNKKKNVPPQIQAQDEYDFKRNIEKFNKRKSSSTEQTFSENSQKVNRFSVNSNVSQESVYSHATGQFGEPYFHLDSKIDALSNKNDSEHNDLRKELERKIDQIKTDLEQKIKDTKEDKKWIIGIIVAVIITVIGYFVLPYQNQKEIIRIQTTIDEKIKPSIEQNSHDIKSNTEKIYQIQTKQDKTALIDDKNSNSK